MTSSKQFSTKPTMNTTTNNKKSTIKNNNTAKQFNNSSKQFTEYQQQQHVKQQKVQAAVNNKRLNANTRPNTRIIGENFIKKLKKNHKKILGKYNPNQFDNLVQYVDQSHKPLDRGKSNKPNTRVTLG